jgi:hypothetical protein
MAIFKTTVLIMCVAFAGVLIWGVITKPDAYGKHGAIGAIAMASLYIMSAIAISS